MSTRPRTWRTCMVEGCQHKFMSSSSRKQMACGVHSFYIWAKQVGLAEGRTVLQRKCESSACGHQKFHTYLERDKICLSCKRTRAAYCARHRKSMLNEKSRFQAQKQTEQHNVSTLQGLEPEKFMRAFDKIVSGEATMSGIGSAEITGNRRQTRTPSREGQKK